MQSYDVLIYEIIPGKTPREKYEKIYPLLQNPITSWKMEIGWMWGRDCRFKEISNHTFFKSERPTLPEIAEVSKEIFTKILKSYTYDCGNKDHPLNPKVTSIKLIPQADSVDIKFESFGFSEIEKSFK